MQYTELDYEEALKRAKQNTAVLNGNFSSVPAQNTGSAATDVQQSVQQNTDYEEALARARKNTAIFSGNSQTASTAPAAVPQNASSFLPDNGTQPAGSENNPPKSGLAGIGERAWNATGEALKGAGTTVVDAVTHPGDTLKELGNAIFVEPAKEAWNNPIGAAGGVLTGAGKGLGSLWNIAYNTPGWIKNAYNGNDDIPYTDVNANYDKLIEEARRTGEEHKDVGGAAGALADFTSKLFSGAPATENLTGFGTLGGVVGGTGKAIKAAQIANRANKIKKSLSFAPETQAAIPQKVYNWFAEVETPVKKPSWLKGTAETAGSGAAIAGIDALGSDKTAEEIGQDIAAGALIGAGMHGLTKAAKPVAKGTGKLYDILYGNKYNEFLDKDGRFNNRLATTHAALNNMLGIKKSPSERVSKYMTLDEAILRNSQPMENNFTAEHLKQIEEARNLSEKQGEAIFKSAKTGQSLENALKGVEQQKKSPGQLRKEAWEEKKELRVKNGLEKIKAIEKQIEERKNKRVQEETAKAEAAQKEAEWWKKLAEEENAQIEAKEANHISENAKNKEVQERLNAKTPLKNPDKNETGVNTPKQIKTVEYPPAVASQKGFYVIPKVTGGSKNNPVGISKETQAKYTRQNQRMAENGEQLTLFGGVEYPAQTNAGTFPNAAPKASFWSKYKKPEGKVGREITKEEWQKRFRKLGQEIPKEEWEKKYGNKKGSKSPVKDETGINTPKEDKTPQNDHSPSTQNEHSNSPKQTEKAKEKKSSEKPKRKTKAEKKERDERIRKRMKGEKVKSPDENPTPNREFYKKPEKVTKLPPGKAEGAEWKDIRVSKSDIIPHEVYEGMPGRGFIQLDKKGKYLGQYDENGEFVSFLDDLDQSQFSQGVLFVDAIGKSARKEMRARKLSGMVKNAKEAVLPSSMRSEHVLKAYMKDEKSARELIEDLQRIADTEFGNTAEFEAAFTKAVEYAQKKGFLKSNTQNARLKNIPEQVKIINNMSERALGISGIANIKGNISSVLRKALQNPQKQAKAKGLIKSIMDMEQSKQTEQALDNLYAHSDASMRDYINELIKKKGYKYEFNGTVPEKPVKKADRLTARNKVEDMSYEGVTEPLKPTKVKDSYNQREKFILVKDVKTGQENVISVTDETYRAKTAPALREPFNLEEKVNAIIKKKEGEVSHYGKDEDISYSFNDALHEAKDRVHTGRSTSIKLKHIMTDDHPLSKMFKKLGDIEIKFVDKKSPADGHFDNNSNSITIFVKDSNHNYAKTVFHEARHAIQRQLAGKTWFGSRARKLVESCKRRNAALQEYTKSEEKMAIVKKVSDFNKKLYNGEITNKEFVKNVTKDEYELFSDYTRVYNRYKSAYLERDARKFSEGNFNKKLFGKDAYEIEKELSPAKSKRRRTAGTGHKSGTVGDVRGNEESGTVISTNGNRRGVSGTGTLDRGSVETVRKSTGEGNIVQDYTDNTSSNEFWNKSIYGKKNKTSAANIRDDAPKTGENKNVLKQLADKNEIGTSVEHLAKKIINSTEETKIKYGILVPEQAENRLKQQGGGVYLAGGRGSNKSGIEDIDLTKDYNASRNNKEGLFGRNTTEGFNSSKTAHKQIVDSTKDYIRTKHSADVVDYLEEKFAKSLNEKGEAQTGYVKVNKKLLATAVYGKYSKEWYETLSSGEEAIYKAFKNEKVAKAWAEVAKRNSGYDFQIPEAVYNKIFDGSGETVAEYWSRYWKNEPGKALFKTAGSILDVLNNSFKRGVLASGSFVLNNRGNQIMIAAKSNPVEYIKSFYDAAKIKKADMPVELVESSILEAVENYKARQTYTGWQPLDNFCNLFSGHTIDTSNLKFIPKVFAKTANVCIGMPNKAYNKIFEGLMKFNSAIENFERKQMFGIQANRIRKDLVKKTGQHMITTKEAIQHIQDNPEIMETVIKNVEDTLGDYNNFNHFERQWLKRIVPFYSWYRTITRHAVKLAKEKPERAALILLELKRLKEKDTDLKEYQRASLRTGIKDKRSEKELLSNKSNYFVPYYTFQEFGEDPRGSLTPAIRTTAEAMRGKKYFHDSEITSREYMRHKPYGGEEGYIDKDTGKFTEGSLPWSVRRKYLAKELGLKTVYPALSSRLIQPEAIGQALVNAAKTGEYLEPDKIYDADLGGYYNGEHFADFYDKPFGKEKKTTKEAARYAANDVSQEVKWLNRLGAGLQNKQPLSKKDIQKLKEELREKYKRQRKRMHK